MTTNFIYNDVHILYGDSQMKNFAILFMGNPIGEIDAIDSIDAIEQAQSYITVETEE